MTVFPSSMEYEPAMSMSFHRQRDLSEPNKVAALSINSYNLCSFHSFQFPGKLLPYTLKALSIHGNVQAPCQFPMGLHSYDCLGKGDNYGLSFLSPSI